MAGSTMGVMEPRPEIGRIRTPPLGSFGVNPIGSIRVNVDYPRDDSVVLTMRAGRSPRMLWSSTSAEAAVRGGSA